MLAGKVLLSCKGCALTSDHWSVLPSCCCSCWLLPRCICCGAVPKVARTIIAEGCERCATNEDVWLEAARLQPPEMAKAVLARGVANIPTSYKLWMAAARLGALMTPPSRGSSGGLWSASRGL